MLQHNFDCRTNSKGIILLKLLLQSLVNNT
ncbi:hypothetical protein V_cmp_00254 [Fowlpox virus]|nr:hypothetical protein V_cmp_00006 [Fowlpox virus]URH28375.1 hypothetical protein V_cmp_00254 [Fowlpox virus]URH28644.1 hypothetical protein V_kr_00006 [Fowlpox virus]URH28893.1 hypothetical protein V_kr_00255 [Fowlpox virus]